jgi:hypothetical protein
MIQDKFLNSPFVPVVGKLKIIGVFATKEFTDRGLYDSVFCV